MIHKLRLQLYVFVRGACIKALSIPRELAHRNFYVKIVNMGIEVSKYGRGMSMVKSWKRYEYFKILGR